MDHKLNGQKGIYDIVNKEKLDVVNNPIAEAHGLPNECYNNKEYTKIERKKLKFFMKISEAILQQARVLHDEVVGEAPGDQ